VAKTKEQKQVAIARVEDILKKAKSVVFLNFHGLGMAETAGMRAKLGEEGVGYLVAKKTLTRLAAKNSAVTGELPQLAGELAIAWGEDETGAARGVYEFQKRYGGNVTIQGGIFDGHFVDQAQMTEIAQIPSLDVLRGMFVNVINSPIQGLVIALNQIAERKA
jgi:large subunit ribosomal protein L10